MDINDEKKLMRQYGIYAVQLSTKEMCSWTVLLGGIPRWTGLGRDVVDYYQKAALKIALHPFFPLGARA